MNLEMRVAWLGWLQEGRGWGDPPPPPRTVLIPPEVVRLLVSAIFETVSIS